MYKILSVFLLLSLVACKPMIVELEKTPVSAPSPSPLNLKDIEWRVFNLEEANKLLEKHKGDSNFVIYVLTPDGFESFQNNLLELRRFILEQQQVIVFYNNIQSDNKTTTGDGVK